MPKILADAPIIVARGLSFSGNQSEETLAVALTIKGAPIAQIVYPAITSQKL